MRRACPVLLAGILIAGVPVPGAGVEIDEQALSYSFRNFVDSDDIHVVSHFARYNLDFNRGAKVFLQWNHETVTVPGVEAAPGTQEAVDAITTASRPVSGGLDAFQDFSKIRNEFQGDVTTSRVQAGYYLSIESDYFAQLVRASYNHDFLDENLNLSFGSSYGWDTIEPLEDEDTAGLDDNRATWNWNVVATQILSPTMLLRAGGDINLVQGLQHSPYRNVYAGGGPVAELHPDERLRTAAFVKVSRYFRNRSSLQGNYVIYRDDWGVMSHTLEARLHQYVTPDAVVRYRYRFYTQTAADFYRDEYEDPTGINGYRTADYRLEAFNSHLFGAQLDLNLGILHRSSLVLSRAHFKLKYERYMNGNNFSANILESGLVYQF
jgi:hypothetical protein